MDASSQKVSIELKSMEIVARCSCGAGIAGYHYIPQAESDPADLMDLAQFFTDAFHSHVNEAEEREVATDSSEAHAMQLGIDDVELGKMRFIGE